MVQTALYDLHKEYHALFIENNNVWIASHFGNVKAEYAAFVERAVAIDVSHWFLLQAAGPDRKTFLHNMLSNEVNKLQTGEWNFSLFLTNKGKIITDFLVFNRDDEIWLIGKDSVRQKAFESLNKFLIMEDAEITDLSDHYAVILVLGAKSDEIVSAIVPGHSIENPSNRFQNSSFENHTIQISASPLPRLPGFLAVCPNECAASFGKRLLEHGASFAGIDTLDILRMEAGIPWIGKELDETVIPQEAGLHHALSFEKGCYIGQEVVARLHFRGHVNRELTGFVMKTEDSISEALPVQNADGKRAGKITSTVKSLKKNAVIGLGYLACALRKPETKLQAMHQEQAIPIEVHDLPF